MSRYSFILLLCGACGGAAPATPAGSPSASSNASGTAAPAGHHHDGDHDGDHDDHHGGDQGADHGGGMHHDFKGADQWAKVFDDPSRDQWQRPDEVAALLELGPGMTVADVGAGTGYFVGRLAQRVGPAGSVVATDLEPDMVRYLGERGRREGWTNVRPLQVAADDPGLAKASVDRVLIVDVWHHLDDRRAYAAKLAAALRPGGLIAVVDFELTASHGPPPKHRLAPAAIEDDLRSAGLTVELAKEELPEQYVVIARAPR
jgi:SAM-dependent methyltransferase